MSTNKNPNDMEKNTIMANRKPKIQLLQASIIQPVS